MVDDAMEMAPGRTYVRFICLPAYLVLPELFNLFDNILVKYQSVTYVSHLMQLMAVDKRNGPIPVMPIIFKI